MLVGQAMLARGRGAVVNVASIMGILGSSGVRVNAVAPCFVRTPLTRKLLSDNEMVAAILDRTPLGRLATPEEVAASILFLASDAASMITGHTLPVDGGWLARSCASEMGRHAWA